MLPSENKDYYYYYYYYYYHYRISLFLEILEYVKIGHNMMTSLSHNNDVQGSYRQVCVKFKDFSRTSKRLSYGFQGLKTNENTD